jgi:hypothetical protein
MRTNKFNKTFKKQGLFSEHCWSFSEAENLLVKMGIDFEHKNVAFIFPKDKIIRFVNNNNILVAIIIRTRYKGGVTLKVLPDKIIAEETFIISDYYHNERISRLRARAL